MIVEEAKDAHLRGCTLEQDSVQYATEENDGDPYERARVKVPKSGWALKKFPGVYAWTQEYNDDASAGWNKDLVVLEKGEPIPTIKKYNV